MIVTVPGVRARLFKQNLISNLFQSGLFQFAGWESHISEPSAPRCRVSLLKIFTLWAVERQQEFVERWDYLAWEKRANLPCVVVAAVAGGSILSFFSLFPNNILVHTFHARYYNCAKTVVMNASVELSCHENSQRCSSDLHSIPPPLVQWTFGIPPRFRLFKSEHQRMQGCKMSSLLSSEQQIVIRKCDMLSFHQMVLSQPHGMENYSFSSCFFFFFCPF